MDEERPLAQLKQDQGAETAGLSAPLSGDPLPEHAAAEIGIDQAPLDIRQRLAQLGIGDARSPREACKRFVFEYPRTPLAAPTFRIIALSVIITL